MRLHKLFLFSVLCTFAMNWACAEGQLPRAGQALQVTSEATVEIEIGTDQFKIIDGILYNQKKQYGTSERMGVFATAIQNEVTTYVNRNGDLAPTNPRLGDCTFFLNTSNDVRLIHLMPSSQRNAELSPQTRASSSLSISRDAVHGWEMNFAVYRRETVSSCADLPFDDDVLIGRAKCCLSDRSRTITSDQINEILKPIFEIR
jgi:hypothetical protein